jgi:UDP-2,3-diacylglucosamine pyrophosphatase LpxH
MNLIIVSDLHIGSRFFTTAAFEQFLNQIPEDCEFVLNGDVIDSPFMKAFKLLHKVRVRLGARPVHVAEYAKKWEFFYKILRKNVMTNAVKCALENGFESVTCGHTHYAEDIVFNGVRYINTGAWTEVPSSFLHMINKELLLKKFEVGPNTATW